MDLNSCILLLFTYYLLLFTSVLMPSQAFQLENLHKPLLALLIAGAVLFAFFSPLKVAAILFALGMIAVTFYDPKLTILFLAVLIPLEPFLLKFVPDELYVYARYFSEVLIYLVALSACVQWARGIVRVRMTPALLCIVLIVGDAVLSAYINQTPFSVALLGTRQIIRFLILFCAVSVLRLDREFIRRLIVILFSMLLFQSVVGIGQAIIGAPADNFLISSGRKIFGDVQLTAGTQQFWDSGQRIFATMGRYDQLGTFLCLVLLLGIGALYEGVRSKALLVMFALGIPTLVLTYSRASWFGFLLGAFVIAYLIKRDRRVLIAYSVCLGVFLCYVLFSWGVISQLIDTPRQTVLQRLSESISPERWRGEYAGLGRLYYVVHTPQNVIPRSPLFGVGPGSYGGGAVAALHYTAQYDKADIPFGIYGTEGYIDNNWFSIWGELGTVGLALFIALFIFLVRTAVRVYRSTGFGIQNDALMRGIALAFCGIAAAVAFQALLGTYLEVRTLAFYFWLLAGILVSYENYCRQ